MAAMLDASFASPVNHRYSKWLKFQICGALSPGHKFLAECWEKAWNSLNDDGKIWENMGKYGNWLVVLTILKNMKVNGKDYPIYYGTNV